MTTEKSIAPQDLESAPQLAIEQLATQLGNTLVLAPHPDDESLGAGGLIRELRNQGVQVYIVFITSGGASHPNSQSYPPSRLAALRKSEAREACKLLGVENDNIVFLERPDGALQEIGEQDKADIISDIQNILEFKNIKTMLIPWRRDPHPDHMATYQIARQAVTENIDLQIVEYPIWLWHLATPASWPSTGEVDKYKLNINQVLDIKSQAIFAHKSQTSTLIDDDPKGFILTEDLLKPFLQDFEYYFFKPKDKNEGLNKTYFDNLYSNNKDPWNFTESDYEHRKYERIDHLINGYHYEKALELGCSIGIQSRYFAKHCSSLLAVDISNSAIETAKELNPDLHGVTFKQMDITEIFPNDVYNFISMCELGYFLSPPVLASTFNRIRENLSMNGHFLMVHWTSFVREFPMSGKEVHKVFELLNESDHAFVKRNVIVHDRYELVLWEKIN